MPSRRVERPHPYPLSFEERGNHREAARRAKKAPLLVGEGVGVRSFSPALVREDAEDVAALAVIIHLALLARLPLLTVLAGVIRPRVRRRGSWLAPARSTHARHRSGRTLIRRAATI